jgi:predicted nuclease of predicted toxin-antitoxin system
MARLYSNENFPLKVAQALRANGHDVLTVVEAGQANQEISDEEVLAYATRENRAVLTLNRRDFIRLHQAQPNHAGIIVCT